MQSEGSHFIFVLLLRIDFKCSAKILLAVVECQSQADIDFALIQNILSSFTSLADLVGPEEIPLPEELKTVLSSIARSFLEEKGDSETFDELIDEYEEVLGDEFETVSDYLPDIIQAEAVSVALAKEKADALKRFTQQNENYRKLRDEIVEKLGAEEPAMPPEPPGLKTLPKALEVYQKEGSAGLLREMLKNGEEFKRSQK